MTWDVVSGDPSARTTDHGDDPNGRGQGARRVDHHLPHQRARLEDGARRCPAILRGLRERGFRFVPLSELMAGAARPAGAPVAVAPAGAVRQPAARRAAPGGDLPPRAPAHGAP